MTTIEARTLVTHEFVSALAQRAPEAEELRRWITVARARHS